MDGDGAPKPAADQGAAGTPGAPNFDAIPLVEPNPILGKFYTVRSDAEYVARIATESKRAAVDRVVVKTLDDVRAAEAAAEARLAARIELEEARRRARRRRHKNKRTKGT